MGPDTFDCAGLVWFLYHQLYNINIFASGIGVSTTTKIMTSQYGTLTLLREHSLKKELNLIKKGDILFFHRQSLRENEPKENNKYPGHCGIYLGDNHFIHASKGKGKVVMSKIENQNYWFKVLVGYREVISTQACIKKVMK